ncbi:hypothetical protein BD779DRAFT_1546468 [Infundibulicybe gibba]|nr:hypothetical protein BD779DRAFT_1546468 [Infundibulicybe gibba]
MVVVVMVVERSHEMTTVVVPLVPVQGITLPSPTKSSYPTSSKSNSSSPSNPYNTPTKITWVLAPRPLHANRALPCPRDSPLPASRQIHISQHHATTHPQTQKRPCTRPTCEPGCTSTSTQIPLRVTVRSGTRPNNVEPSSAGSRTAGHDAPMAQWMWIRPSLSAYTRSAAPPV